MQIIVWIAFTLLVYNGVRSIFGIPPMYYWRHAHMCKDCEGVGWIKEKHDCKEIVNNPPSNLTD